MLVLTLLLTGCSTPTVPTASVTPSPVVLGSAPTVLTPAPKPEPTPEPSPEPAPRPELVFGGDISWPSCPVGTPGALPEKQGKGLPLPGPDAQFVVIGLTNGPGFHPNPCLAWEVRLMRARGLHLGAYAFTTLPNADQVSRYGGRGPYPTSTHLGRLRNASWAQAQVNLASLRRTGLQPPLIWMDVEPQPYLSPWGRDVAANRATILAVRQAYLDAGFRTGLYSSDTPWRTITGGLQLPDPTWVTVGPRGRAAALAKCAAPTFSGGPAVLAQWWDTDIEDLDLTCPRRRADAASLFSAP